MVGNDDGDSVSSGDLKLVQVAGGGGGTDVCLSTLNLGNIDLDLGTRVLRMEPLTLLLPLLYLCLDLGGACGDMTSDT